MKKKSSFGLKRLHKGSVRDRFSGSTAAAVRRRQKVFNDIFREAGQRDDASTADHLKVPLKWRDQGRDCE